MELSPTITASAPLTGRLMAAIRREAIFTCCKWDPQVGDVAVISDFALMIPAGCARHLGAEAEQLYGETLAAEEEIARSPRLLQGLGLPPALASALADEAGRPRPAAGTAPRVMRFDFHPTDAGWKISEVNSDVPGGYVEAAGISTLMAAQHPGCTLAADPVAALIAALHRHPAQPGPVGLVHATAYTDDRQVMVFLQRRFRQAGVESVLLSPSDLQWSDGRASAGNVALGAVFRFFPAEWLPNLPGKQWRNFFRPTATLQLNPGWAAISQSKRFPLAWASLRHDLPAWRRLLPETIAWQPGLGDEWVSKPNFGRVGDGIGIGGVTTNAEWKPIAKAQAAKPADWIAQRRFRAVACPTPAGPGYPCLGVYVIDGRAAGIYGRIASRPLIDHHARDVAVLVAPAADPGASFLKSA